MKATIEQLRAQLQQEPDNAALYYQLGVKLQEEFPGTTFKEKQGECSIWNFKGIEEMQKATELDPMNYQYMHTYALFREQRGDLESSLDIFKRCAQLNPTAEGLRDDIVRIQGKIKNSKSFLRSYAEETLKKKPADGNAMRVMGMAYGDEGNLEEALKWFNKAIEVEPEEETNYAMVAMYLHRAKKYEEAIAAYKTGLEHYKPEVPSEEDLKDPDYKPDTNAATYIEMGRCFYELKDFDNAELYYRQALATDPDYVELNINLADIEYDRGNYAKALAMFKDALTKVDTQKYRHIDEAIGLCYLQLNDLENARINLEKCIKKNPGYSRAYYNLSVVFNTLGDEDGVEMVLQMAVQANQGDVNSLYRLAEIYKRKGYYRDALELLEKALYANPFEVNVMRLKAEIYSNMGDSEKAEMEDRMAKFVQDMKDGKPLDFGDEEEDDEYDEEDDED